MHEKKLKGDIGVTQVIAKLTELNWSVGIPISEHQKYDIFAEKNGIVHTVQVRYTTPKKDKITIKLANSWSDKNSVHIKIRKKGDYTLLAVYCPSVGVFFIKEKELGKNGRQLNLRLTPSKNKQKKGIKFAADFTII